MVHSNRLSTRVHYTNRKAGIWQLDVRSDARLSGWPLANRTRQLQSSLLRSKLNRSPSGNRGSLADRLRLRLCRRSFIPSLQLHRAGDQSTVDFAFLPKMPVAAPTREWTKMLLLPDTHSSSTHARKYGKMPAISQDLGVNETSTASGAGASMSPGRSSRHKDVTVNSTRESEAQSLTDVLQTAVDSSLGGLNSMSDAIKSKLDSAAPVAEGMLRSIWEDYRRGK